MVTWARLELATPKLKVLYSKPSELPGQVSAPVKAQTYHSSISLSSLAAMLNEQLARPMGLEPTTFPVTGEYSNHLNYERILNSLKIYINNSNLRST